jgi:hypothetical protein
VQRHFAHQLLSGARQLPHLLDGRGLHEAAADEAMGQQVRNP